MGVLGGCTYIYNNREDREDRDKWDKWDRWDKWDKWDKWETPIKRSALIERSDPIKRSAPIYPIKESERVIFSTL